MAHSLSFVFLDGREIAASTPRGVIEALRAAEPEAPADLGRYLAMLAIRAAIVFDIALDVGAPGADIDVRCRHTLSSMLAHGWLRVKGVTPPWRPRERRRPLAHAMMARASAPAETTAFELL